MRIIAVDDEKLALDALLGSIRKAAPEAEIGRASCRERV